MRAFPILRLLTSCAAAAVLCAAVARAQDAAPAGGSSQTASAQQPQRTDSQIEMDVVHALDASDTLKNDLITAATIESEVTLSGTVSSASSKQLAESIASHVNGVTKVHNNLTVGNPGADGQPLQPAPDSEDMPDADQSQAQQGMANLPPPGPGPGQGDQQQGDQAQPRNQGQAPAGAPPYDQGGYPQYPQAPQQGGYPAYPPQRPEYQNPYSQYPQQVPQSPQYPQAPPQPQAPPEPGYGQGPQGQQYGQQQQFGQAQATPQYPSARGPLTLQPGTLLQLRTSESIDSKRAVNGQPVDFMVIQDVTLGGYLAIPRGALIHGMVTESKNVGSGQMAGRSTLALTLTSLDLAGRNYQLQTDEFKVKAPNKAGQTVGGAVTGGLFGAIIGCAIGRGPGCLIGAGAGAAAGTAAGTAAPGARAWIPAEALVTFRLEAPLTVDPVSPQVAARLAQGLYPGGSQLYHRYPYGSSYYGYNGGYSGAAYSPYSYPAPFYIPYYMVGGVYYWR